MICSFFFFNDTATTEIYPLSLHDALPICHAPDHRRGPPRAAALRSRLGAPMRHRPQDRKSTRLNSSHSQISYAVFCLKKKTEQHTQSMTTSTTLRDPYVQSLDDSTRSAAA